MMEFSVRVTVIIGVASVSVTILAVVLSRPISLLWDRCLQRRRVGWLPPDAEGQASSNLNCPGRSNEAERGSNQGLAVPAASAVGTVIPMGGEVLRLRGAIECRTYSTIQPVSVEHFGALETQVWEE